MSNPSPRTPTHRVARDASVMALVALGTAVLLMGCQHASGPTIAGTLLPSSEAAILRRPCSRPGPPPFEAVWVPSEDDIALLNSRLPRIGRLRAACCIKGARIDDLRHYSIYFLPIVSSGRRLIYVVGSDDGALNVCDGGEAHWGAIYDPATGSFSDLFVNGVA